jgi:hypothetical protein
MKYAVEIGSGAMIYIPSFIKIVSGIQKLMGAGFTDRSLLSFFKNKEGRLINKKVMDSQEPTLHWFQIIICFYVSTSIKPVKILMGNC